MNPGGRRVPWELSTVYKREDEPPTGPGRPSAQGGSHSFTQWHRLDTTPAANGSPCPRVRKPRAEVPPIERALAARHGKQPQGGKSTSVYRDHAQEGQPSATASAQDPRSPRLSRWTPTRDAGSEPDARASVAAPPWHLASSWDCASWAPCSRTWSLD